MAKISEQFVIIKMSKLFKNESEATASFVSNNVLESLSTIVEEMINDDSVVVEVENQ